MWKFLLRIVFIVGALTVLSVLVPDPITSAMDDAIVYFGSSLWSLNGFFNVATLLDAIAVLGDFIISLGVLWIFMFFFKTSVHDNV